jgi:hypothetical protein
MLFPTKQALLVLVCIWMLNHAYLPPSVVRSAVYTSVAFLRWVVKDLTSAVVYLTPSTPLPIYHKVKLLYLTCKLLVIKLAWVRGLCRDRVYCTVDPVPNIAFS